MLTAKPKDLSSIPRSDWVDNCKFFFSLHMLALTHSLSHTYIHNKQIKFENKKKEILKLTRPPSIFLSSGRKKTLLKYIYFGKPGVGNTWNIMP